MHYKNGTPAKEGDGVILKLWNGVAAAGTLHSANPGTDTCNGKVAVPVFGGIEHHCVTIGDLQSAGDALAALESIQARKNIKPADLAGVMYEVYCDAVGGKAFNGDALPKWEEFRADAAKQVQSDAWVKAAAVALAFVPVAITPAV